VVTPSALLVTIVALPGVVVEHLEVVSLSKEQNEA